MPNTIEWSEREMHLLIDLRKERNIDYWRRFGRSKVPFWNEIAMKIEEDLGMKFTGVQCKDKFKGMVKDCKVSKILVKEKIMNFILIGFVKIYINNFDILIIFFFQAEDGIRDLYVTGVQTCALPICAPAKGIAEPAPAELKPAAQR